MGGHRGSPGPTEKRPTEPGGSSCFTTTTTDKNFGSQHYQPESKSPHSETKPIQSVATTYSDFLGTAVLGRFALSYYSTPAENCESHQEEIDKSRERIVLSQSDDDYIVSYMRRWPIEALVQNEPPNLVQHDNEPQYHKLYNRAWDNSPKHVGFHYDPATSQSGMVDGTSMVYGRNQTRSAPRNPDPTAHLFHSTTPPTSSFTTDNAAPNNTFPQYSPNLPKVKYRKHREYCHLPMTSYNFLKKTERLMFYAGDEELKQKLRDERNKKFAATYPLPGKSWAIFLSYDQEQPSQIPAGNHLQTPADYEYDPSFSFLRQINGQPPSDPPTRPLPPLPPLLKDTYGSSSGRHRRASWNFTPAAGSAEELREDSTIASQKTRTVEDEPSSGS